MPNPFNPLDWAQSAQDWFSRMEKSSGFRPFLVFDVLVYGFSLFLLQWFSDIPGATQVVFGLIIVASASFIILFAIKAFTDPDFCRSETHLQRMRKIELEAFGTETKQVKGEVIEQKVLEQRAPTVPSLGGSSQSQGRVGR